MNHSFDVLCENLLYLHKSNQLTQREMAQLCHISVGALRRLEKGDVPPRLGIDFIGYISLHFGVSPGKLFSTSLWSASRSGGH